MPESPSSLWSSMSESPTSPSALSSSSSSSSSSWSSKNFVIHMVCPGEYIIQDKSMATEPVPVRKNYLRANTCCLSQVNLQKVNPKAVSVFLDQCDTLRSHKKFVNKLDESLFFDLFVAAAQLHIKGLLEVLFLIAPYVIKASTYDDVVEIMDVIVYENAKIHHHMMSKRLESLRNCLGRMPESITRR